MKSTEGIEGEDSIGTLSFILFKQMNTIGGQLSLKNFFWVKVIFLTLIYGTFLKVHWERGIIAPH